MSDQYLAYTLKDERASAKEAKLFSQCGGKTIIEMTPIYYGRDVRAYQRIAREAGIHVVCCTGFHKELFMPPWFREKTQYQLILEEIQQGIDGTSIRPGALTATEAFAAYRAGADVVKIFPAGNFGADYLKELRGPCDFIPYAAVGGVNVKNIRPLLDAGYRMAAIGGNLVDKNLIIKEEYGQITKLAKQYMEMVK